MSRELDNLVEPDPDSNFYQESVLDPALVPFVHSVVGYQEFDGVPSSQQQVPTVAVVPMIIVLGHGWDYQAGSRSECLGTSFLAGVRSSPVLMLSQGHAVCVQVNFTLRGARRYLGIDMSELAESIYSVEDVLGQAAKSLEERLGGMNGWPERFAFIEAHLKDRLLSRELDRRLNSAVVKLALETVDQCELIDQRVSVSALSNSLGVSRKHLVALFTREIGVSPSRYLQLKQLSKAIKLLGEGESTKLIDVALACGYADQAHFNRQFRRFMQLAPSEYVAGRPS